MIIFAEEINVKLNVHSYNKLDTTQLNGVPSSLNVECTNEIKVVFNSKLYGDLEFTLPILSKTKQSEKELDLFTLNRYYTEAPYRAFKMLLTNMSYEKVIYTNYFKY